MRTLFVSLAVGSLAVGCVAKDGSLGRGDSQSAGDALGNGIEDSAASFGPMNGGATADAISGIQYAAKRGGGQSPLSLQAEDPETGLTIDPPSHAPAPDADLLNAEKVELVRVALDQLEQPCREIIELRYFGDLSYEELSIELNLNPKTVSSRLSKCLDRLEVVARKIFLGEKTGVFPSN